MTDTERLDLENFLLDIDCLNGLNPWIDDINIFEILKMSKMEIRHSNFLAWLLNPKESHSFGDRILKDVICHVIKHDNNKIDKAFNIIDANLWDYQSFDVYREKYDIDVLIVSNDEKKVICIENKIFSEEHSKQTIRYRKILDKEYPNHNKLFIFLTPDGYEAIDFENWVALSYRELIKIIKTNMLSKSLIIGAKEKMIIEDYISGVKNHIMGDENLKEICAKIYFKHRQALDLIFENKPDIRNLIFKELVEKFEREANSAESINFDKNGSNQKIVRFNTPYSLKLFPKLSEPKSMWKTNFMFCYEINVSNVKQISLTAVVNNCDLSKEEFEKCKNIFSVIDKNWRYRTSPISKNVCPENINFDEMSEEEFNGDKEKENIITSIFDNVIEAVEAFENNLKNNGFNL